ncbi:MAG: pseudouridine synthase [Myxococcota bacterium]|jgi:23S rRNA pseudouridine2605 synthase|nr:pseudouridine synthase [Myxococcota bacterium]
MAARKKSSSSRSATPRHRRRSKRRVGAASARPAPEPKPRVEAPPGRADVKLQKLLAAAGFGSRRACETLIEQGRVTINGKVATLGDRADPATDAILFDGERLGSEKPTYWIVNKPEGVITSVSDPEGRPTILSLMPPRGPRVYPVGRLDLATSGLVLLTNDGAITQLLLHPSLGNEREYRVTARGEVSPKAFERLQRGLRLEDGRTNPCEVSGSRYDPVSDVTIFHLTLREGRKRQIRRSMQHLKHPVKKLVRVRMGPLRLGRLATGEARPLRRDEIRKLQEHAAELRSAAPTRRRGRPKRG